MEKASRIAKKTILTEKDFTEGASKNEKIFHFKRMLANNMYQFRVKHVLYEKGKISPKGFLFNDNIYNLPLGTKNGKGEILIDNDVLPIFDRYLLGESLISKGDALTAFVVDHSDFLYETILKDKTAEVKMTDTQYIEIFSMCYSTISNIILDNKVNFILNNTPELNI
jgi:hypothetical protein